MTRFRTKAGRRAIGIFLALIAEGLLVVLLLTINPPIAKRAKGDVTLVTFSPEPATPPIPEPPAAQKSEHQTAPLQKPQPAPIPVPQEKDESEPPFIPLSPAQMASADIAAKPSRPDAAARKAPIMGPIDTASASDTPRVSGAGPNGEPLYAAAWYRKPYDEELSGYLSTASGPGWGQIACKTVPDYRVDDCVAVGEYPQGSNIARAVLAAAWQFRVMPPRIGGKLRIGEWVQIRIDYDLRRH